MKNFNIHESEFKRILNLHETATKRQYLTKSIISEDESSESKTIAAQIYNASMLAGTDDDSFLSAIEKINTIERAKKVDELLKSRYTRLGLEGTIQDEYDPAMVSDRELLDKFNASLSKIGIKLTYNKLGKSNSIKLTWPTESKPQSGVKQPEGYYDKMLSGNKESKSGAGLKEPSDYYQKLMSNDKTYSNKDNSSTKTSLQSSPKVAEIQTKLTELGYGESLGKTGADGKLGPKTLQTILDALNNTKKPTEVKQNQETNKTTDSTIQSTSVDIKRGNY